LLGLFYDGVGNEVGVEMAIGEANKLNVAAAVAMVKAAKDEEEARRNKATEMESEQDAAAEVAAADGQVQDTAQSQDDAKGVSALYQSCPWVQFSVPDLIYFERTVYILTDIQSNPFPPDRWQTASFKTENEKYLISHVIKQ